MNSNVSFLVFIIPYSYNEYKKKYSKIKKGNYTGLIELINMKQLYRKNANICYSCKYHIVWCPKFRRPVLEKPIADRLKTIIQEIIDENNSELIEMEILENHVHLLVECDPQFGIHRLVKRIKGNSSRKLRSEFPKLKSRLPTLWTNSYFVATVGGAPLSIIKQYIENQINV